MKMIQILGSGCPKCKQLAEVARAAAGELGIEYKLEKVTDLNEIIALGVMMTPALVVDGEVKIVGKIPPLDEVKEILRA